MSQKEEFKCAMRRLASTVTVITSVDQMGWTGMAATAVMSVTTDPPTMLIAVNKSASLYPAVRDTSIFCVNLLGESHDNLVPIFSGALKGSERFEHGHWFASSAGPPILADALASIVCAVITRIAAGSHEIFIGTVTEISNHPRIDPLLWVDGRLAVTRPHNRDLGSS